MRLIRWTGVPLINRITRINHVIQRVKPAKGTNCRLDAAAGLMVVWALVLLWKAWQLGTAATP